MANFLYNGVELPDIDSIWEQVGKTAYPYVLFSTGTNPNGTTGTMYFVAKELVHKTDGLYPADGGSNRYYHAYYTGGTSWSGPNGPYNDGAGVCFASDKYHNWAWSNFEILNVDGSVFLTASTPIRVDSKLKISIGGGSVTATTADVNFTCSNLENTEPVDSIHAWVYKKSDGLNATISPTWTSEMFAAPSYSTSYTFTGLTPNTEYEVYGCIFVNGEATDHNAIAAFTTLEGEGEEEPVITETSGDGFALYNGVKLPSLPNYDKTKYPYAWIAYFPVPELEVWEAMLLLSPTPFHLLQDPGSPELAVSPNADCECLEASAIGGKWSDEYGVAHEDWGTKWLDIHPRQFSASGFMDVTPSWSSFDFIDNLDNSIYLAASDPIPLDGMTVIEWNGGTAGLTNSGTGLYKITDDVLASNQVIGGVFVQNVSSKLTAIRVTSDVIEAYEGGIRINAKIYSAPANALMPEAGTYFPKLVSDYVSLFAYPNAADLKPVYKRAGGVWVKKTAYERQNGEWVLISTAT